MVGAAKKSAGDLEGKGVCAPPREPVILDACHRPDCAPLPPERSVMRLLDKERRYPGSVSSISRMLRRQGELTAGGPRHHAVRRGPRPTDQATGPNQV